MSLKLEFKLQVGGSEDRIRKETVVASLPDPETKSTLSQEKVKGWGKRLLRAGCYLTIAGSTAVIVVPPLHLQAENSNFTKGFRELLGSSGSLELIGVSPESSGGRISQLAMQWEGKEFNPGYPSQQAFFIREIFSESQVSLGVSQNPVNAMSGQPSAIGTIPGLAGVDASMGSIWISDPAQVIPGDIVFLASGHPQGHYTDVGIAIRGGEMIYRPSNTSVIERKSYNTHFAGALRL